MFFKQRIKIKRKTNIDLGNGSFREDYIINQCSVPADIQGLKLQDIIRAGRKINSVAYDCYLAAEVDVLGDDRIEYDSNDYTIVSILSNPDSNTSLSYTQLYIEKIV